MEEQKLNKKEHHFFAYLRNNFITGLTALLPLWAVIVVITFLINLVNDKMLKPLLGFIHPYLKWADPELVAVSVKVALFVVILLLLTLFGALVKNFFIGRIFNFGERILMRIPLINKVYRGMQQLSKAFLMQKQAMFRKSVLVEYPKKGTYVLAFLTADAAREINAKTNDDLVSVFVPTTPNPTSGFLLFVPRADIIELRMSIEDGFKLIVSFGAVAPGDLHHEREGALPLST
jgi:uncharacterized membrane protein